ncbi:MAG: TonB-dependent receptor [Bacteroidales bacterium]|nr:TonB-dependent receptor [Bacteroidales bacterium]
MKSIFNRLILATITLFAGISLYAQVTTASLDGKVTDIYGAPVPGVAIVATHVPSGTYYGVVTNADGHYFITGLRAGGPYKIEYLCLGYQPVTYNDVTLSLGDPVNFDVKLADNAEQIEAVVVTADKDSKFTGTKTGASTNISRDEIMSIPNTTRSIADIARISPYGGNGMSFGGSDGRSTNFTVDGSNFNNNFGLNEDLPGGGNPISIDAIEEIQIVVSPFDVRQTNFIGGGVNAITKSGTNEFHGSAYAYHANENMHGNRVANEDLGARLVDRNTLFGLTFGGPIVKNKLFFFVNAEYSIIPTVTNRWRVSTDGVANKNQMISRTLDKDMDKVIEHLDQYSFNPGSYKNFSSNENNLKLLARIDWNITDKHHLALRYNFTGNKQANPVSGNSTDAKPRIYINRASESSMYFNGSDYWQHNEVHSASLDLNSRLSDNVSNQLLATYSNIHDWREANCDIFPFVDIMDSSAGTGSKMTPYLSFGHELFSYNNAVHNHVVTVKDDVTMNFGAHKLTAGLSYEFQYADNSYMRSGTGYYRYASLDDFLQQKAPESVGITYGYGGQLNPSAKVRFHQLAAYAQDEWSISDKFKLTAGLRLDTIIFDNNDLIANPKIAALDFDGKKIDVGLWPKTRVQVSPRIGFNWDVLGDGSLKVRGGTGLFLGRLPLVFLTNMPTNSGMIQMQAMITSGDEALKQFAGKMITKPSDLVDKLNGISADKFPKDAPKEGVLPYQINAVDREFKMPQVWKSTIGIDYDIPVPFPFTVSGEFTFNKTVNGTLLTNYDIKDATKFEKMEGGDNRYIYPSHKNEANKTVKDYVLNGSDAFVLTNTDKGYGYLATVGLDMSPLENLRLTASYTYTASKELTGMPGSAASSAYQGIPTVNGPNYMQLHNSQYVIPHRVMASLTWSPGNSHFSLFYEGYVPGGLSYCYQNDVNGDGIAMDLVYIPKDKNELAFVSEDQRDLFWSFVEQDKYLSSHKGQYAEAYAVHAPMVHRLDFRYAYDFKFKIGRQQNIIRLSADFWNALNLVNSRWGVEKTFSDYVTTGNYGTVGQILVLDHMDGKKPVYTTKYNSNGKVVDLFNTSKSRRTFDYNHAYGQCWYLQLGIKYMF